MVEGNDGLKKKIVREIERSGFPLEMEIGNVLRSKNWYTRHSPLFFDLDDLRMKEYDIVASRQTKHFEARLYIECKHSEEKNWVFYVPDRSEWIWIYDLKYFPKKPLPVSPSLLKDSVFKVLGKFCDSSEVALNSSIIQFRDDDQSSKKKKNEDPTGIREAIRTSIKALIADNISWHSSRPNYPGATSRMNFAIVVFDGHMFSYIQKGKSFELEARQYVKYRQELPIDYWNYPEDARKNPFFVSCANYERTVGTSYIAEIVHKNHFGNYLDQLDGSLKELDKSLPLQFKRDISPWFVP